MSTAPIEEEEVLVEDWVSDSYLKDAYQPLAIEPLASSLSLVMAELFVVGEERFVGVDNLERQVPYSEWFQCGDSIISIVSLARLWRVWKIKQQHFYWLLKLN